MQSLDIRHGLILFIILASSLCLKEAFRAWLAFKLGDDTAEREGRLTLNPIPHIDLLGTIIVPLICIFYLQGALFFGWAKPAPFSPSQLRHGLKGELWVTIAGSIAGLGLMLLAATVGGVGVRVVPRLAELPQMIILLNAWLFAFNILPVPPFDGAHILRHFSGMTRETFDSISRWAPLLLLVILSFNERAAQLLNHLIALVAFPFLVIFQRIAGG